DTKEIAEIKQLRKLPTLIAHLLLANHYLNFAALAVAQWSASVPQVDKMYVALDATQDDTATGANCRPLAFRQVGRKAQDVADGLMAVEAAAARVDPEFLDLAQLLRSVGFKVVGWRGHGSGFLLEDRQRRCLTGERWILAGGRDVSIAVGTA